MLGFKRWLTRSPVHLKVVSGAGRQSPASIQSLGLGPARRECRDNFAKLLRPLGGASPANTQGMPHYSSQDCETLQDDLVQLDVIGPAFIAVIDFLHSIEPGDFEK